MPLVFGYIAFTFPQGAVLYWVVSSVVGIVQQYFTSGWGSLANYLKFLPPDGKPSTLTPALAPAAVSAEASAVAAPRADFWSVMRPLTEAPEAPPETPAPEPAQPDAEEAPHAARPAASVTNPRKPRRRK